MVGAVGMLAGNDLRRRWRGILVVTVLVGVVGAFTMGAVAGARRTGSSLDRFRETSRSADIELAAESTPAQLQQLVRIPGVVAVASMQAYGLVVPAAPDFEEVGAPVGTAFGTTIDRDRIVAGHAPDPDAVDQITIGEAFAARLHLRPGSPLDVESFSPKQVEATLRGAANVGAPSGPRVRLRVAGTVRRTLDLGDRGASGGLLVLTPAFDRAYANRIGVFGSRIRVRTADAPGDVPAVLAAIRKTLGDSLFSAQGLATETLGASNAIDVVASALWIAAAVAGLAGAVAITFALGREISVATDDKDALRELGCTRGQQVAAVLPCALVGAAGGAALSTIGAILLSPRFPVGVARRADPNLGFHADWTVLALGVLVVVSVVAGIAIAAAYRATRPSVTASVVRSDKVGVVGRVAAAGMAPPVTNGVRMALEPGRGPSAVPMRSAFAGAVCGVLGVTAVVVFAASLRDLASTPRAFGSRWDFTALDTTSNTPCEGSSFGLDREPGIATLAELCVQNVQIDGRPTGAIAFTRVTGASITPEIISGRAPSAPNEVAVGTKTLDVLGKRIGDTVQIEGRRGKLDYEIVGRAVFPSLGPTQPLADGAAFTGAGYKPLYDQNLFNRFFVGTFARGADRPAVRARIDAVPNLGPAAAPVVPVEIDRLRRIDWLPVSLAAFLGGLATVAVGHAIIVASRRRRRELAILKTLGFSRRQVRATLEWQATTLGVVGIGLGIPAGLIVGRLIWGDVARGLGVAPASSVPALAVALTAVGALFVVNALAFFPGITASRVGVGRALRSE